MTRRQVCERANLPCHKEFLGRDPWGGCDFGREIKYFCKITQKGRRVVAEKSKAEAEEKDELEEKHCEWLLHLRQYVGDVGFVEG